MKARRKVCREAVVRGIGPLEGSQAFVPNVRGMLAKAFRAATVVAVFGLVIYASHSHGVPDKLPAAALDWRLLFHAERAAAVLASFGVVLLVGWRAMHGEFPMKFGNVEYAVKEAAADAEAATNAQERRIQLLEAYLGIGPGPPPAA